jgi:competence protein ComEC
MKQWPLQKAYVWEQAPFLRLLLPLIAGILCYRAFFYQLHLNSLLTILVALLVLYIVSVKLFPSKTFISFISAQLFLFFTAVISCHLGDITQGSEWIGHNDNATSTDLVIVKNEPEEKEKTYKLNVEVLARQEREEWENVKGNALLYVYKNEYNKEWHVGDTLLVPSTWQSIKNAGNPFEFDYALYTSRKNIYHQQFIGANKIKLYGKAAGKDWITETHLWCMQQLHQHFKDPATLGIMQAMLVGDEANLDDDIRDAYAETGIIHIIAISGSHIAIFFFGISLLFRVIRSKKYQWVRYLVAIPFIWLYVLIAGATPSAIRAAVMFSILGIGLAFRKEGNGFNQLFAAAFIILFFQPMWLYSAGFQLSFVAVLSIFLFYKPIYHLLAPKNYFLRLLWSAVSVSLAAELLVAPLVAFYFHLFPISFIITNIVAGVYAFIVLLGGMLVLLFSWLPIIASLLAVVITWATGIFNSFITFFQSLNPVSLKHISISAPQLLLLYLTIMFISWFILAAKKKALYIGLSSFSVFIALLLVEDLSNASRKLFVVYNISNCNHIELVDGFAHTVLYTDGIDVRKKNYVLKNAHIGWKAWEARHRTVDNILSIGQKRIAILNAPVNQWRSSVDYLVVNFATTEVDMQNIIHLIHPGKIVLGSKFRHKQIDKLLDICKKEHVATYVVSRDGAFVLESF